jgi:plastocyanin
MEDPAGSGAYAFDPSEMTFNVGDTIEFTISAESEYHTFTVDELGIDAEADGGDSTTFSFTFNEAGSFALICIPHEALGMTGTITVQ